MRGAAKIKSFCTMAFSIFQRKSTRCYTLRPQGFHRPAGWHFFRNNTVEIIFYQNIIDNGKPRSLQESDISSIWHTIHLNKLFRLWLNNQTIPFYLLPVCQNLSLQYTDIEFFSLWKHKNRMFFRIFIYVQCTARGRKLNGRSSLHNPYCDFRLP